MAHVVDAEPENLNIRRNRVRSAGPQVSNLFVGQGFRVGQVRSIEFLQVRDGSGFTIKLGDKPCPH